MLAFCPVDLFLSAASYIPYYTTRCRAHSGRLIQSVTIAWRQNLQGDIIFKVFFLSIPPFYACVYVCIYILFFYNIFCTCLHFLWPCNQKKQAQDTIVSSDSIHTKNEQKHEYILYTRTAAYTHMHIHTLITYHIHIHTTHAIHIHIRIYTYINTRTQYAYAMHNTHTYTPTLHAQNIRIHNPQSAMHNYARTCACKPHTHATKKLMNHCAVKQLLLRFHEIDSPLRRAAKTSSQRN